VTDASCHIAGSALVMSSEMVKLVAWSMEHRRRVIAAWIALLVVSIGAAGSLKNHFDNNLTLPGTDAQRAADLLHSRFPARAGDSDQIVFDAKHGSLSASSTRSHGCRTSWASRVRTTTSARSQVTERSDSRP
jgi:hypothetical protein